MTLVTAFLFFLAALFGLAVVLAALFTGRANAGRRPGQAPQLTIEERVTEIASKIGQLRKLHAIASAQSRDPVIADLVSKHDSIILYLMDYLDKYEAQLLRLRFEAVLDACKHRDIIDEVIEAKEAIGMEKKRIESVSQASAHEALERQYTEILGKIDEIIRLSLINSTRNILAQESPIQQSARLRSLDFPPINAGNALDDIESLNQAYDKFIAETQL